MEKGKPNLSSTVVLKSKKKGGNLWCMGICWSMHEYLVGKAWDTVICMGNENFIKSQSQPLCPYLDLG